jgi:diguanylate cyclase (GGDEF)-like protein
MFIDLDRFKHVNDEMDHPAGDVVLSAVGDRLMAMTRGVDVVARMGGDEFAVFAEVDSARDAIDIAERLRTGLAEPIGVCDKLVTVTASIGVVVTTDGSTTAAALLREADHAMYDAKRRGGDQAALRRTRARDVAALRWGLHHPRPDRVSAG